MASKESRTVFPKFISLGNKISSRGQINHVITLFIFFCDHKLNKWLTRLNFQPKDWVGINKMTFGGYHNSDL